MDEVCSSVQVVVPCTRPQGALQVVSQLAENGLERQAIVVDDTADGRVARALLGHAVQVVRSHRAGPGAARTLGARAAAAEWLLLLDDDIVLPAGFGRAVAARLAAAPPGLGVIETAVRATGSIRRPYWRWRLVENSRPGPFLSACLLVRRRAFLDVGGMMAGRAPFREDADLAIRIQARGHGAGWAEELAVEHPVERMTLARFLYTGTFFRYDAVFNRRHPGYLERLGRPLKVGPFVLRGLRRRLPLLGLACAVPLALALPWRWAALAGPLGAGLVLNAMHLRALRRAGMPAATAALVDPLEIAAHTAWGLAVAAGRLFGELECLVRPNGPWKEPQ